MADSLPPPAPPSGCGSSSTVAPVVPPVLGVEVLGLTDAAGECHEFGSRPTGTMRQQLEVHKIDVPSDPEENGSPFSSFYLEAAVGEHSIAVAVSTYQRAFLFVSDKKTWKVRRMASLQSDASGKHDLGHAYVAAGGGFGGVVVGKERPFTFGEPGEPWRGRSRRSTRTASSVASRSSSTPFEPRVVWAGKSFAGSAGRASDSGSVPRATSSTRLEIGGVLLWQDGSFHVAMLSSRDSVRDRDPVVQIVHADPAGHIHAERCPDVKLGDD